MVFNVHKSLHGRSIKEILRHFNVLITALAVLIFSTIATRGIFFSGSNLLNVGERASILGIVAIGQTIVILAGGIDLSVGAIMSVSYTSFIVFEAMGLPLGTCVIIALATGMLFGLINGFLVVKTTIPPILVTLSTMFIGFSASATIIGSLQLRYESLKKFIDKVFLLDATMSRFFPTLIWILLSIVFIVVLSKSRFGLSIFAVGGGAKAAHLAGVKSKNIQMSVYVISGLTAALAGLIFAYRIGFLMPNSSIPYLIESIAAVILGGTNIKGGEGSIYGSFLGAFVIASLLNVLSILRVDPFIQYSIMGFILILIAYITSLLLSRK